MVRRAGPDAASRQPASPRSLALAVPPGIDLVLRGAGFLGDIGPRVPLIDAFAAFASPATDERVQSRLSLESIGVIGRTLLREGRTPRFVVERLARQAMICLSPRACDLRAARRASVALRTRTLGGVAAVDRASRDADRGCAVIGRVDMGRARAGAARLVFARCGVGLRSLSETRCCSTR